MKYVVWKDYKAVAASIKRIYQPPTEQAVHSELESFGEAWNEKPPQMSQSWSNH